jgi:hypothetical protein
MAYDTRALNDYVDVAQRLADFREQYPEGSLQPANLDKPWEQVTVTGYDREDKTVTQTFIVYTAAAYRHPLDVRPGIGIAWEVFPGRTNFTRGSEIMNAETSAWGRAILAVLASETKRGVASREEIRNRNAEREEAHPRNRDGSLSLSRMDDGERAAAGLMTKPETQRHNALRREGEPPKKRVQRVTGPDEVAATWETGSQ